MYPDMLLEGEGVLSVVSGGKRMYEMNDYTKRPDRLRDRVDASSDMVVLTRSRNR